MNSLIRLLLCFIFCISYDVTSSTNRTTTFGFSIENGQSNNKSVEKQGNSHNDFDINNNESQKQYETLDLMKVREAMKYSTNAGGNITAASTACQLWKDILSTIKEDHLPISDRKIIVMCCGLYAASLVRIGKDEEALDVYERALASLYSTDTKKNPTTKTKDNLTVDDETRQKLLLGKASALQRLLRYSEAKDIYLKCPTESGIIGAATCSLRVNNDPHEAIQILTRSFSHDDGDDNLVSTRDSMKIFNATGLMIISPTLMGMILASEYISSGTFLGNPATKNAVDLKNNDIDGIKFDALYEWIRGSSDFFGNGMSLLSLPSSISSSSSSSTKKIFNENDALTQLIKVNLCPFDDPSLLYIDDKLHLHEMLTSHDEITLRTSYFWPTSFVIPASDNKEKKKVAITNILSRITKDEGEKSKQERKWLTKQRAGYGSHGNVIITESNLTNLLLQDDDDDDDTYHGDDFLLQRMVEPSLLLDGRKFSLRIYVIYFSPSEVYLCNKGLVKLASVPVADDDDLNSTDPRIHMTNSGRETLMEQRELNSIEEALIREGSSFNEFWMKIRLIVKDVFFIYNDKKKQRNKQYDTSTTTTATAKTIRTNELWETRRIELGIPKILGFDFVVDNYVGKKTDDDSNDNNTSPCSPWLVEINRFPGLEPRDGTDQRVKYQVLWEAWNCAKIRKKLTTHPLQSILDVLLPVDCDTTEGSLERII